MAHYGEQLVYRNVPESEEPPVFQSARHSLLLHYASNSMFSIFCQTSRYLKMMKLIVG